MFRQVHASYRPLTLGLLSLILASGAAQADQYQDAAKRWLQMSSPPRP